jgi:hypothetical protein
LVDAQPCREGAGGDDDVLPQPVLVGRAVGVVEADLAIADAQLDPVGDPQPRIAPNSDWYTPACRSLPRAICSKVTRSVSASGTTVFT